MLTGQRRKFLNYDLEILYSYVKTQGSKKAIVAFQDSEAFDPALLGDLIALFKYILSTPRT